MEQHRRGRGNPVHKDDEIISYIVRNPDVSVDFIRKQFNCAPDRASELKKKALSIIDNQARSKKKGSVDWREHIEHAQKTQQLKRKSSYSQDHAIINIREKYGINKPIVIQCLSDLHIGAMATNYDALKEITDGILRTPNLFVILNGDLTETTAVFRNALAVHSQVTDIETQHDILESWLKEIQDKVLTAGWDNHGVEREEKIGAFSHIKRLLNRTFIYHNGMGRIDIEHGAATYKLMVSHAIPGASIFNRLHGVKRLLRLKFPDVDIGITGDQHTPDVETYFEGKFRRGAIMGGTLKIEDGYTKRYFDLYSHMEMPCVVLFPDEKWFGLYMTSAEALSVANGLKDVPRF